MQKKDIKEMQSLINETRKQLEVVENEIAERDYFIKMEQKRHKTDRDLIKKISELVFSNDYGRPDVYLAKIKELVNEYQTQTNSK